MIHKAFKWFFSSSEKPIETDLAPTFLPKSLHFEINFSSANSFAFSGLEALASPNSFENEFEVSGYVVKEPPPII